MSIETDYTCDGGKTWVVVPLTAALREVVCRTPDLLEDPEEAKDLKAPDKTAIQLEKSAERSRHTDDALPVCSSRECAVQEHTNWDFPLSPFWVHDQVFEVLTKWLSNEV